MIIFSVTAFLFYTLFTAPNQDSSFPWQKPVESGSAILRSFEKPKTRFGAGHRGIDLVASTGEAVFAPTVGEIMFTGKVVDRNLITIKTDSGLLITLEPVNSDLKVGSKVQKNQPLGVVSEGAHCHSKCIHIGVRKDDEYLNPLQFFIRKPQLLPLEE